MHVACELIFNAPYFTSHANTVAMKYNARLWEEIYAARALETEQGVVGERADE